MFNKIEINKKEQLDELYKSSALTFQGVWADDKNINGIIKWLKNYSELSDPLNIYIITGKIMNEQYHLTGKNKYPEEYQIISIKNEDIKEINKIIVERFSVGAKWFDDIVNNNARREESKFKPKCELIGKNGNIYNLMRYSIRNFKKKQS